MNCCDNNQVSFYRRMALRKVVESFDKGLLETQAYRIPFEVIPPGSQSSVRCCIYKEQAIFRTRVIAALGYGVEEDDGATSPNEYAQKALNRKELPKHPLTVVNIACEGCPPARHLVTESCQGCLTRHCQQACKFGAISIVNTRSVIDPNKCKNCGMCKDACPYHAIIYIPVPCEQACPVDAIHKDKNGLAKIDFDKCISCGHCMPACPFGAITERSQIIDILSAIKKGKKVCALLAPSIVGQFENASLGQLITAVKKAGFAKVTEVAKGADLTTHNEARELVERLENGVPFMTTSCCAAWVQAVKKHLPALKEFISQTKTPAAYTASLEKENGYTTVFIGPCVSKRAEGMENPDIDYVMTYEELGVLFASREIVPAQCEETKLETNISAEGRYYGVTGGVAQAVENAIAGKKPFTKMAINGLDKKAMLLLKSFAKGTGNFQLLEVMNCKGGCIGGPCTLQPQAQVIKPIKELVEQSPKISCALKGK